MKIISLKGQITLLSGLHIGGGDNAMEIGGIDNPVIKTNGKPYIPGSSLKGKMRSLLEINFGLEKFTGGKVFDSRNFEYEDKDKKKKHIEISDSIEKSAITLLRLFGDANPKKDKVIGITRLVVGDCHLSEETLKENYPFELTEIKKETAINRAKGMAQNGSLRETEIVKKDVKFDFDIRIKILNDDKDEKELKAMLMRGLELVEKDYLGGNGSRGYGRIEFSNKTEWETIYPSEANNETIQNNNNSAQ